MSVTGPHQVRVALAADEGPILVAVNGSRSCSSALLWAATEAQATGRRVHVVHGASPVLAGVEPVLTTETESPQMRQVEPRTDEQPTGPPMTRAPAAVLEEAEILVRLKGPDVEVACELVPEVGVLGLLSRWQDAAVLVIGGDVSDQLRDGLSGSLGHDLPGRAPCPVVVVPQWCRRPIVTQRIVVGVDGSRAARDGLDFAMQMAAQHDGSVTALMASTGEHADDGHRDRFAETLALMRSRFPDVDLTGDVVRGAPVAALVAASYDADLVVLGARRPRWRRGLLSGSVGHAVLQRTRCPVAVVGR